MFRNWSFEDLISYLYLFFQKHKWGGNNKFCMLYGENNPNGCNCLTVKHIKSIKNLFKDVIENDNKHLMEYSYKCLINEEKSLYKLKCSIDFDINTALYSLNIILSEKFTTLDNGILMELGYVLFIMLCICVIYIIDTDYCLCTKQSDECGDDTNIASCLSGLLKDKISRLPEISIINPKDSYETSTDCKSCISELRRTQDMVNFDNTLKIFNKKLEDEKYCEKIFDRFMRICNLYNKVQAFLQKSESLQSIKFFNMTFAEFINYDIIYENNGRIEKNIALFDGDKESADNKELKRIKDVCTYIGLGDIDFSENVNTEPLDECGMIDQDYDSTSHENELGNVEEIEVDGEDANETEQKEISDNVDADSIDDE